MNKNESQIEPKTFNFKSLVWEIVKTIFFIVILFFVIRLFIQPFNVSGQSMEPSFYNGDYLLINRASYKIFSVKRGDVIVFKHPEPVCDEYLNGPLPQRIIGTLTFNEPCRNYIKRIIALPGEKIEIKNGRVTIYNDEYKNGLVLDENYISPNQQTLGNIEKTLNKGEYFVLGDNRGPNMSSDSREWGPITKKYIVGKVWVRLFPLGTTRVIPSPSY